MTYLIGTLDGKTIIRGGSFQGMYNNTKIRYVDDDKENDADTEFEEGELGITDGSDFLSATFTR